MKLAVMVISLADARAAAAREDWWEILGIDLYTLFRLQDVQKARREFMGRNHPDKGGNLELCQIVNNAADALEEMMDHKRAQARKDQNAEEERRAQEEERRARLERLRAEELEREVRLHEECLRLRRVARTKANFLMLETVHQRTRNKITLGEYAGRAFPVISRRSQRLKYTRKVQQSRIMTYAVETEIAARRANREDKWPKTAGLDKRCPDLAASLAALKKAYDKSYQSLRYLSAKGKLHGHALLTTRRLMREAWMLYLALPAPMRDDELRYA